MTTEAELVAEAKLVAEANADPTDDPKYVTVLYGDYGNWKTTAACSMVNESGLLISSDDSWKVLLNPRHKDIYNKIKVVPYDGLSQLSHINLDGYDTIIWDTVSHSVDMYLDLLYDEARWGGNFREKIITKNPELKQLEALGFIDYRVTRDSFRPAINRLLKESDSHIVFTSQMREPIPGMGKNQQKRPSIPEATFKIIGTRADIIASLTVSGNRCTVDVSNSLTKLGKTRIESIQGSLDLDTFIKKYKETVF